MEPGDRRDRDGFDNMKRIDDLDAKLSKAEEEEDEDLLRYVLGGPQEHWPRCAKCGDHRPASVVHPKDKTGLLCWWCAELECSGGACGE